MNLNDNKYYIVVLIGESASGKDTLLKGILNRSMYNKVIKTTTRPIRSGETPGKDYYFISPYEFNQKRDMNFLMAEECFNGWRYGYERSSFKKDKVNLMIGTPQTVRSLMEDPSLDINVIRIEVKPFKRFWRAFKRTPLQLKEVIRRWKADKKDFANLDFEYAVFKNDSKFIRYGELEELFF